MDRQTNRSRGFGHVEMGSDQEAQDAITGLNGQQSDGRTLTVNEVQTCAAGSAHRTANGGGDYGNRY